MRRVVQSDKILSPILIYVPHECYHVLGYQFLSNSIYIGRRILADYSAIEFIVVG